MASANEMINNNIKFLETIASMARLVAPNIFRNPISFVRLSTEKDESPNNPSNEIKIAIAENKLKSEPVWISLLYRQLYSWSRNIYSNGIPPAMRSQILETKSIV